MCVYIQLYVWILETIYACVDWENNPQHQGDIVFSSPMPYAILQKKKNWCYDSEKKHVQIAAD